MHKAMQEDTVATQTSNYIPANEAENYIIYVIGTIFIVSVVLLVHFNTSTIRVYLHKYISVLSLYRS